MSKPTHKTAKKENPGSGGRGAMRRAHAVTQFDVIDARDKRIAELEAALTDVLNSYEDERARIKAGNADKPSVSGQTFINRARMLLRTGS